MQPPVERAELKRWLAHVRWIGGAPCAGKSSIVTLLAERYEFEVYRCDEHFAAHTQRVEPRRQPTLHRLSTMSWNEIWMQPERHRSRINSGCTATPSRVARRRS